MLEYLAGDVQAIGEDAAVIAIGGVGVRVRMPTRDLASLEGSVRVHTVLVVREDEMQLYGFRTERARRLFEALRTVSGVGPRVALAILSAHEPEALERAIAAGDTDALTLVPGVGRKTASRIVLELKDKLGVVEMDTSTPAGGALAEVREALKGMGFSAPEVQEVLASLPPDGDAPTLLRHALRSLGSREVAGVDG